MNQVSNFFIVTIAIFTTGYNVILLLWLNNTKLCCGSVSFYTDPGSEKISYGSESSPNFDDDTDPDPGKKRIQYQEDIKNLIKGPHFSYMMIRTIFVFR